MKRKFDHILEFVVADANNSFIVLHNAKEIIICKSDLFCEIKDLYQSIGENELAFKLTNPYRTIEHGNPRRLGCVFQNLKFINSEGFYEN